MYLFVTVSTYSPYTSIAIETTPANFVSVTMSAHGNRTTLDRLRVHRRNKDSFVPQKSCNGISCEIHEAIDKVSQGNSAPRMSRVPSAMGILDDETG